MYLHISYTRDRPIIYRYPLFVLHRLLYMVYACYLYNHITFGI